MPTVVPLQPYLKILYGHQHSSACYPINVPLATLRVFHVIGNKDPNDSRDNYPVAQSNYTYEQAS